MYQFSTVLNTPTKKKIELSLQKKKRENIDNIFYIITCKMFIIS